MEIELIEKPLTGEIDVKQLSEEWFALRLCRITGSKFDTLMPSSKQRLEWNDTQMKILKEIACQILTGERKESFTNSAMQWGIDTEEEARRYYELVTMQTVRESGFWVIDDNIGDSPDGIVEESQMVWECKCPASTTHLDYFLDSEKLFKNYKWQCYGHMWATGLSKGDLVSYDPRFPSNKRLVVYSFEKDEAEMKKLQDRIYSAVEVIKGLVA